MNVLLIVIVGKLSCVCVFGVNFERRAGLARGSIAFGNGYRSFTLNEFIDRAYNLIHIQQTVPSVYCRIARVHLKRKPVLCLYASLFTLWSMHALIICLSALP
jgi:hypothetical protein